MEAGGRRERPPGGRGRIVRDVRRVASVPGDREMPSRRPAHGAEDQHPLQLAERNRLTPGPVGQRAVRDFPASREAPRATPEQRLHQREILEFPQRADIGTYLLNAHLVPLTPPYTASSSRRGAAGLQTICNRCEDARLARSAEQP